MNYLHPDSAPHGATVIPVSFEEMVKLDKVVWLAGSLVRVEAALGIELPEGERRIAYTGQVGQPEQRFMTKEEYGRFYEVEIAPNLEEIVPEQPSSKFSVGQAVTFYHPKMDGTPIAATVNRISDTEPVATYEVRDTRTGYLFGAWEFQLAAAEAGAAGKRPPKE